MRAGRRVDELRDRLGTPLLGEADQREQDLRRRLGVGERPVARRAEVPKKWASEARPTRFSLPLEQAPGQPHRVDHGSRHPPARQPLHLAVEKAQVEAGVVGDEDCIPGELEKAPDGQLGPAGAPCRERGSIPVSAAIGAGSGPRGLTSVSNRSSSSRPRTRTAPISQIAELLGESPVVSRSKTTYVAASSASAAPGASARPTRAAPGEPRVAVDDVREQRACEPDRDVAQRVERLGGVLGGHGPVPGLDELHQAVGRVERQLHAGSLGEHMFVCNGKEKAASPARPSRSSEEGAGPSRP